MNMKKRFSEEQIIQILKEANARCADGWPQPLKQAI